MSSVVYETYYKYECRLCHVTFLHRELKKKCPKCGTKYYDKIDEFKLPCGVY